MLKLFHRGGAAVRGAKDGLRKEIPACVRVPPTQHLTIRHLPAPECHGSLPTRPSGLGPPTERSWSQTPAPWSPCFKSTQPHGHTPLVRECVLHRRRSVDSSTRTSVGCPPSGSSHQLCAHGAEGAASGRPPELVRVGVIGPWMYGPPCSRQPVKVAWSVLSKPKIFEDPCQEYWPRRRRNQPKLFPVVKDANWVKDGPVLTEGFILSGGSPCNLFIV